MTLEKGKTNRMREIGAVSAVLELQRRESGERNKALTPISRFNLRKRRRKKGTGACLRGSKVTW